MFTLAINRQWHYPNHSVGELILPNNKIFCFTLSDTPRAWGVKVNKATSIPPTSVGQSYHVAVTFSHRFQKELPIIYTYIEDENYILKNGGIEFSAVRFHGGNDSQDTDGCELVGYQRSGEKIFDSAEDGLTKLIKEQITSGESVNLVVRNSKNKL